MEKKQTAVRQLLNAIPEASEIKDFIEENNADTKMLDEWLWERIYKGRDYLQMEREQIEEARQDGYESTYNSCESGCMGKQELDGSNKEYYTQTFKP